ncbi:MAG: substrate-binding domain-containing protein [Candidatus Tectomicrobia bacterium]|nr:substrate-binding domain-containing protein [Candidatus Tectomicrobia bacterium]
MRRATHTPESLAIWLWIVVMLMHIGPFDPLAAAASRLRLGATTTIDNSGLLQHVLASFAQHAGARVQVVIGGTGQVLQFGQQGDVDVVWVHAPQAEAAFVQSGFGVQRHTVMANDFVLIGPHNDPAGVRDQPTAVQALRRIAAHRAVFISRGDESGTHKKERTLWQKAGVTPENQRWYLEVGQGMGAAVQIANTKQAYTLVDRGTYLAYHPALELTIVHEGDPVYTNPYSVIAVNPQRHPHVNHASAMTFIHWLTSPQGQQRIESYRKQGQVLFHPHVLQQAP